MKDRAINPSPAAIPPIEQLVPHAAPMILLDRVLNVDAETLRAEVKIRPDSLFHEGDGVGSWVGIEYMAQAIAAYAGYQSRLLGQSAKIGFLLGSRRYECAQPVFATGSTLHVTVQLLLKADNGLGSFACTITDQQSQQQLAQATVSVFEPHDASQFLEGSME
ncbi:hotdog family protein [Herbaspirillum lusitanum]|uniref:Hotdog family protein n=1 Tax=Herbaspirillum lusitanum TaxID=213312 RepID=A0ABW9A3S5_9BURK